MSQLVTLRKVPEDRPLIIENVGWREYTQQLKFFAERPGYRLTYDRGRLEIMPPLLLHDDDSRTFHALILTLAEEQGVPIKHGGSTTLRRMLFRRGIEADECFWFGANAARMAGKRKLDLRTDPPPDLAVEVDVTHSPINRLTIYATFNVPEVWRLKGRAQVFHILGDDGTYRAAEHSRCFPLIAPVNILAFIQEAREASDQIGVIRRFREWFRNRLSEIAPQPEKKKRKRS